jgi:hypothetical protein
MTTRIQNVSFLQPEKAKLFIDPSVAKRLVKRHDEDNSDLPQYCFLRAVSEKLGAQTKEKLKCGCGTQSYGNAKFCRECGTKLARPTIAGIQLDDLNWSDEDDYGDCLAADTFFQLFVQQVVPHLQGYAECSITFGEDQDDPEDMKWQTAHFVVNNGELTWCEIQLRPGASAPVFDADNPYEQSDDEDEDEDDEDEDDR